MKPWLAPREPLSVNLTPMIDVVFLLIIFFLVSSHLAQQETHLELDLPDASSGEQDADTPPARVTINVLASGAAQIAGERVEAGEIGQRLRRLTERRATPLEVRIRTDRQATYAAVEPILLECVEAGVRDVTFAVYEP
ncbi:biopolymer transport protein ExbD [Pirellulimonas nuda]|uniref:Biopolymer transport protein ExbD n=1 Tax=Pirellulimonas nuda TaxID=2528009 RepID=A0A518D5H5_9BACT|nr:biopolymer transporter ExbD [Pirellulimonas nuda]QDU86720.1 biopolymer transport protein ExbD [Pirellulimonas nuda]